MNRRRSLIARLAPWLPPGLSLALCAWSPAFARRWRDGISLPAMRALHRLTARLPFPALEPLAIAAAAAERAGLVLKKNPSYMPVNKEVQLKASPAAPDIQEAVMAEVKEKTGLNCRIITV